MSAGVTPTAADLAAKVRQVLECDCRPIVSDTERDRALAALGVLTERLAEAEQALAFYADDRNWTQPTSWGGRIHDDESRAIRDGGRQARAVLGSVPPHEETAT